MAHRSGGGSHHGGSHHHSSSSHHGGTGRSGPRRSRSYFSGARRYRYLDRRGNERFIYMDSTPQKTSVFGFITSLLFLIPFLGIGIGTAVTAIGDMMPQKPLDKSYVSPDTHIYDVAGVMYDESDLEKALSRFEKKSGICPVVLTVDDEYWIRDYYQLDDFAYDYYVQTFDDEQHFLVVYSQPEGTADKDDVNWAWESIQGDETDPIITDRNAQKFEKKLQKCLENEELSIEEAMTEAFEDASEYMPDTHFNIFRGGEMVSFSLLWNVIVLFTLYVIISSYRKSRIEYTEVPLENGMIPGNGYDMLGAAAAGTEVKNMFGQGAVQNSNLYSNAFNNGYNDTANMYQNAGTFGAYNSGMQNAQSSDYGMPQVNIPVQNNYETAAENDNEAVRISGEDVLPGQTAQPEIPSANDEDDLARRIRESYKK